MCNLCGGFLILSQPFLCNSVVFVFMVGNNWLNVLRIPNLYPPSNLTIIFNQPNTQKPLYQTNTKYWNSKTEIILSWKTYIKRLILLFLIKPFTRFKHCCILSSRWKKIKLAALQEMVNKRKVRVVADETPITHHKRCPTC